MVKFYFFVSDFDVKKGFKFLKESKSKPTFFTGLTEPC